MCTARKVSLELESFWLANEKNGKVCLPSLLSAFAMNSFHSNRWGKNEMKPAFCRRCFASPNGGGGGGGGEVAEEDDDLFVQ